jgi:hypothetical protein
MRKQQGSILVLGMVLTGLLAVALLIACSYGGLFFEHNRLQASANEMALAAARKLNDKDRLGQMNNMIARSRQLVTHTREEYERCTSEAPGLSDLAKQLLDESRETAEDLENQRQALNILARKEAKLAMEEKYDQIKKTYSMHLPWISVAEPVLAGWQCGRLENISSNVEELKYIENLEENDQSKNYITNTGLKLYKSEIDAKLPSPDNDLVFKISSLPAPVVKTVAPARLIHNSNWTTNLSNHLPSACRVQLWLKIGTGLGPKADGTLSSIGAACATGGCPQQ